MLFSILYAPQISASRLALIALVVERWRPGHANAHDSDLPGSSQDIIEAGIGGSLT
jgi:hypothetical protein